MARANALRREEPQTIEDILAEELRTYVEDGYGPRYSPLFWRAVFINWYGEEPKGADDPRWDELFREVYPILRKLLGTQPVAYF